MKKIVLFLAVMGLTVGLFAAEAKRLTMAVNSLSILDVPFKIEDISVSDNTIASVETVADNDRQFRITGKKAGVIDVQVRGGKMSQTYKITVIANLELLLKDLKVALDAVPEVDIKRLNDRLILKGEISNIANIELKNKVVKVYGDAILDLTTFHPTPEVMIALHKNLEKAGFKVIRNNKATKPGEISITQVGDMLTLTGTVYGPNDLAKIKSIIASQWWLTTQPVDGKTSGVSGKVAAYVNIQVVPEMLQIDIVHLAVNKTEAQKIGVDWSAFVSGGFGVGSRLLWSVDKVMGNSTDTRGEAGFGAATRGASQGQALSAWLAFCGNNGVTRARRAGFLTFKSNDTPQFRKLHNGGTLYISSDAAAGSTSQLKDIEYGLILEVKGGLTGADNVAIEIKQELSYPGPISENVASAKLDLKKFATSTSFVAKLNEPIALGGLKEWTQKNTASDSIPYLRNVPVLKWLIAQDSDTFTEEEILTIVCVRKMVKTGEIDPVVVELNKMKKADDEFIKKREADKHKNDVKWYEFWRW